MSKKIVFLISICLVISNLCPCFGNSNFKTLRVIMGLTDSDNDGFSETIDFGMAAVLSFTPGNDAVFLDSMDVINSLGAGENSYGGGMEYFDFATITLRPNQSLPLFPVNVYWWFQALR